MLQEVFSQLSEKIGQLKIMVQTLPLKENIY